MNKAEKKIMGVVIGLSIVGILLMDMPIVMKVVFIAIFGIGVAIYYFRYGRKPEENEFQKINRNKFNAGEICSIEPTEKLYKTVEGDLEEYIITHSSYFAIRRNDHIDIIRMVIKDDETKHLAFKVVKKQEFFRYFRFSEFDYPESMEEIMG